MLILNKLSNIKRCRVYFGVSIEVFRYMLFFLFTVQSFNIRPNPDIFLRFLQDKTCMGVLMQDIIGLGVGNGLGATASMGLGSALGLGQTPSYRDPFGPTSDLRGFGGGGGNYPSPSLGIGRERDRDLYLDDRDRDRYSTAPFSLGGRAPSPDRDRYGLGGIGGSFGGGGPSGNSVSGMIGDRSTGLGAAGGGFMQRGLSAIVRNVILLFYFSTYQIQYFFWRNLQVTIRPTSQASDPSLLPSKPPSPLLN